MQLSTAPTQRITGKPAEILALLQHGVLRRWDGGVLLSLINLSGWSPKESTALWNSLMAALMMSSISLIYAFIALPLDDCTVSLDMSASYLTLHPEETVKGLILWWTPCLLLPPPASSSLLLPPSRSLPLSLPHAARLPAAATGTQEE